MGPLCLLQEGGPTRKPSCGGKGRTVKGKGRMMASAGGEKGGRDRGLVPHFWPSLGGGGAGERSNQ